MLSMESDLVKSPKPRMSILLLNGEAIEEKFENDLSFQPVEQDIVQRFNDIELVY